ncbi:hypothetical protein DITRI_Ditri14bG0058900 [Diplodiscus trichospermus]
MSILLWCASLLLLGWFPTLITGIKIKGHESDHEALLALKSLIYHDPLGVTTSWNSSVALCQWQGITCGRRHQRLTRLDLSHQRLGGTLSPHIGNPSCLRFINLEDNNFYGVIPPEIGRLSRLESLIIQNNSLGGTIPANLTHSSNLIEFTAALNNLAGNIPAELGNLLKLEILDISRINLTGQLPTFLGNIPTLQVIYLIYNNLHGLSLGDNQLSGSLPINLGSHLPNLRYFIVGINNLSGSLPESLSNASKLEMLKVFSNHFGGKVSINFQNAKSLRWLNIESNYNLGSGGAGDLDFIATLTNCSRLRIFSIAGNQFGGLLPNSITNLSATLEHLYLGANQITGTIPSGITNLVNLTALTFEHNQLTGTIPDSLDLSNNLLNGSFPSEIGNLKTLVSLDISRNKFFGQIPSAIGSCSSLETIFGEKSFLWEHPSLFELLEKHCKARFVKQQFVWTIADQRSATGIALIGNDKLCGGIARLHLPLCHLNEPKERKRTVPLKLILIVCGVLGMQLLKATDGFALVNLIGQGSFGRVYKEILDQKQEQNVIAVKVMDLQEQGASKSFLTKCKTLENVRHRNLVKIISACSSIDFQGNPFKALIYVFMPNGTLERWLH